jgi:leucyl aminopeptidase (aminopeptidase T)
MDRPWLEDAGVTPGWCSNLLYAAQVKPGERVLVVVDEPLRAEGRELAEATTDAGAEAVVELWAGEGRPFQHAPEAVLAESARADVALHIQQAPRGEEGAARFELLEAMTSGGRNGRMIFMGLVDGELLRGELSAPPADVAAAARELLAELEGARVIRIRGRAGTDLTLRVEGRAFRTDAEPLEPGGFNNYPGGEVFVAPLEDGTDGVLVADLTVPYTVDGLVDEPVVLRFERGRVVSIEGGRAASLLRDLVASAGAGADVIAELGLGLYPGLPPRGHVMLDEKAAGTAHVAIGRNTGLYGGVNEASIHVDCVFSAPELEVDGRRVELPRGAFDS